MAANEPFTITDPDPISFSSVSPTDVLCHGTSTGTISATVQNGTAPFLITLVKDGVAQDPVSFPTAAIYFEGLSAGRYQLRGEDSRLKRDGNRGCAIISSEEIRVDQPAPLTYVLLGTDTTCPGDSNGSIRISGRSGGTAPFQYRYQLQGGTTWQDWTNLTEESIIEELSEGEYNVEVKDANECTVGMTIELVDPAHTLIERRSLTHNTCAGQAEGSITVRLSGGSTTHPNKYTLHFYSPGGQLDVTRKELVANIDQTFSGLPKGSYSLQAQDGSGCLSERLYFDIDAPDPISIQLDASSLLSLREYGDTNGSIKVVVEGGTPVYTLAWYKDSKTTANYLGGGSELTNLAAGTYLLEVIDAAGCSPEPIARFTIEQPASPLSLSLASDPVHVLCHGAATGEVRLSASGGWPGYSYSHDGLQWQSSAQFSGLPAGEYIFRVRDSRGVEASLETIRLNEPEAPLAASVAALTAVRCHQGSDGGFALVISGGTAPYYFSLDGGQSWQQGTAASGLTAGSYSILVEDARGCRLQEPLTASITQPAAAVSIVLQSMQQANCGGEDGAASVAVSGGTGTITVSWYSGTTKIGEGLLLQGVKAGGYLARATDANGCQKELSLTITDKQGPSASYSSSPVSCAGESDGQASLSITGGSGTVSVLWPDGSNSLSRSDLAAGDYLVELLDEQICRGEVEVIIKDVDPLTVAASLQQPSCSGQSDGSLRVDAQGGNGQYSYFWKLPDGSNSTATLLTDLGPGTYELLLLDARGCSATFSYVLNDPAPVLPALADSYTICSGQRLALDAGYSGGSYHWSGPEGFSSSLQQLSLHQQGDYLLEVTDARGCQGSKRFSIIIDDGLLKADFLMASQAYVGDTVVVIDISWPQPEAIEWHSPPAGARIISQQGPYQQVVFSQAGTYPWGLNARLAGCTAQKVQSIQILEASEKETGEGERKRAFITARAHPNPTAGALLLELDFAQASTAELYVVSLSDQRLLQQHRLPQASSLLQPLDLSRLSPGIYVLIIKASGHSHQLKVIKF